MPFMGGGHPSRTAIMPANDMRPKSRPISKPAKSEELKPNVAVLLANQDGRNQNLRKYEPENRKSSK
jgi:hypothetical protein